MIENRLTYRTYIGLFLYHRPIYFPAFAADQWSDAGIHHNAYVIISAVAFEITGVKIIYSSVCSEANERKKT